MTRLIETTPIANFTQRIDWDGLERFFSALGLENVINVQAIKEFAESVEETLENPEALIEDITGIQISNIIADFIDSIPEVTDYITFDTINIDIIGYFPMLDVVGPYSFFPPHCYPDKVGEKDIESITRYNSPIIAYVRTGSSIEQHVVD